MPTPGRLSIGTLARQAGVSAQTLRHYDKLGILRPSVTTAAGYRQYTEADRARLDLVRALRSLDFDLPTIKRLLQGTVSARAAGELHLRALDLQIRVLARRRAVLRVLLRDNAALTSGRLQRLQVLALVEDRDRGRFIRDALETRLRGTRHNAVTVAARQAAEIDLPDGASDAQVEAWLELAEMLTDESFLSRHRTALAGKRGDLSSELKALYRLAAAAAGRGVSPSGEPGRRLVNRWIRAMLRGRGRSGRGASRERARELRTLIERERDPHEERFWELLAVIRAEAAQSPLSIAWPWLMNGLHAIAEGDSLST